MFDRTRRFQNTPRLEDILDPEQNSFGALRCLMASLVLISHSFLFTSGTSAAEPLTALTGWSLGEHGVQFFFFMSGLMVAQSLDRSRSEMDFLLARALRIFPALAVCVFLTAFVLRPLISDYTLNQYFKSPALPLYVIKTLGLTTGSAPLPGVFEHVPLAAHVNSSLWTLKYEAICYGMLALAGFAGLMRHQKTGAAVLALALVLLAALTPMPESAEDYRFLDHLRYFVVFFAPGVLAYLVRDKLVISGWLVIAAFGVCALLFDTAFKDLVTALFEGYLTLWVASKNFGPVRRFCNRIDLSYGIYIFAAPIQQAAIASCPGISALSVMMIGFTFAVPLAALSWALIERPALKSRPRVRLALAGFFGRRPLKQA